MKKFFIAVVAIGGVVAAMAIPQGEVPARETSRSLQSPPPSLSKYCPPQSPGQVYLLEMHKVNDAQAGELRSLI